MSKARSDQAWRMSKERTRKYRENIDPDMHEVLREKDRLRKAEQRKKAQLNSTPKQRLLEREYEKYRKQEQRAKKKAARKQSKQAPAESMDVPTAAPNPYPTPASLGKAVHRVRKTLPRSPSKQAKVIATITSDLTPTRQQLVLDEISSGSKERKQRSDAMSDSDKEEVQSFFLRDDISRVSPGRKDFVTVRSASGSKEKRQKRTLVMNLSEAFYLFCEEHDMKIGFSKFCDLKPEHVLPTSLKDQEVCMCKYHENIDLLAVGIKKVVAGFPISAEDISMHTVCSTDSVPCIDRRCDHCSVDGIDKFFDVQGLHDIDVSYYQWETLDGVFTKVQKNSDLASACSVLKDQLKPFARHAYDAKKQHQELRFLKDSLQPGNIIIHEDFSENYSLKQQREVMTAHWNQASVTIFTVIVYFRQEQGGPLQHISYAIVSDDLVHGKNSVYHFNQQILQDIRQSLPWEVNHVHYWSDGAASQFKNKYNVDNLLHHVMDFSCTADWSFFATAHGKGPVDGIGAEVKRQVWRSTLQGNVVVTSAKQFQEVADQLCPKIRVMYVCKDDIASGTSHMAERWEVCARLHGIQGNHFIKPCSYDTVAFGKNSIFSSPHTILETKVMRAEGPSTDGNINDVHLLEMTGEQDIEDLPQLPEISINPGEFIVVALKSTRKTRRSNSHLFVGQVLKSMDRTVEVTFLRYAGSRKDTFAYPSIEDKASVFKSEIIRKLPHPVVDSRGRCIFPENIAVEK